MHVAKVEMLMKNNQNFVSLHLRLKDFCCCYRLTPHARKQLKSILDPPTLNGNDWRRLAQELKVDRQVKKIYFRVHKRYYL